MLIMNEKKNWKNFKRRHFFLFFKENFHYGKYNEMENVKEIDFVHLINYKS